MLTDQNSLQKQMGDVGNIEVNKHSLYVTYSYVFRRLFSVTVLSMLNLNINTIRKSGNVNPFLQMVLPCIQVGATIRLNLVAEMIMISITPLFRMDFMTANW